MHLFEDCVFTQLVGTVQTSSSFDERLNFLFIYNNTLELIVIEYILTWQKSFSVKGPQYS